MMFSNRFLISIIFILIAIVVGSKYSTFINSNNDYDMIKTYLLNESPLYGSNKPKIWIHSKYDLNARKWLDFYSRNSYNLNQPYIELTIGSVINFCSNDFHICLIDDESFSKLIPSLDINIHQLPEPIKTHQRNIAFMKLLNIYGGMIVPDTFLCTKNMLNLYNINIQNNQPFVCERVNRTTNMKDKPRLTLIPDTYFMGCRKQNPMLQMMIQKYENLLEKNGETNSIDFLGSFNDFLVENVKFGRLNLVEGKYIGIRNKDKVYQISDIVGEEPLQLSTDCYGIYIPGDEFLHRPNYQWFSVLPVEEIVNSNMAIAYYFNISFIDSSIENQYNMSCLL